MKRIVKSNDLINACFRLNRHEQRLIQLALAELDSREKYSTSHEFVVTLKQYADAHDGVRSNVRLWETLKDNAHQLFDRTVTMYPKPGRTHHVRWLSERAVIDGPEKRIKLVFSQRMMQHITELKGAFTTYDAAQVADFKSVYSARVFEWVNQYKHKNEREMLVSDIREQLELGDRLKQFAHFRMRVIETACKEISEKTDIKLKYEAIKVGKTVQSIRFKWKKKPYKLEQQGPKGKPTANNPAKVDYGKRADSKRAAQGIQSIRNIIGGMHG